MVGQTRSGCSCHNATEEPLVEVRIAGLPGHYEPGDVYLLNISFEGGAPSPGASAVAGFDLKASAGELRVPATSGAVRVDPATGEATHTLAGSGQASWEVEWRAPKRDTGTVTFTLVVNSVNGDSVQGPGDGWGRGELTVEEGGRGGPTDSPALWWVVGVAVVLAILAVAYLAGRGPRIVSKG